MAAVNLTLYVNVTRQILQAATNNGTPVDLPAFTVGDTYDLKLCFVEQEGRGVGATQYTVISPGSLGCKVGIGVDGGTPDVLQTSFTASGNFLVGTLDCTTAAYAAKVTAGTPLFFEIEVGESGNYKTIIHKACTNYSGVIPTSATTPAPAEEFYTKTEILALFSQFVNTAGRTLTLTSSDGTKQVILGCNNDGSFDVQQV